MLPLQHHRPPSQVTNSGSLKVAYVRLWFDSEYIWDGKLEAKKIKVSINAKFWLEDRFFIVKSHIAHHINRSSFKGASLITEACSSLTTIPSTVRSETNDIFKNFIFESM